MAVELTVTANPKITDLKTASNEISAFIKTPPQNPVQAVQWMAKTFGLDGAISNVASLVPGLNMALPILSTVFDFFSSGPTFETIAIDALKNLSTQMAAQFESLKNALSSKIDESTTKTIETVLAGVDEIARQQSAVAVFSTAAQQEILENATAEKKEIYERFTSNLEELKQQTIAALTSEIDILSNQVDSVYQKYLIDIVNMIGAYLPDLLAKLNASINQNEQPAATVSRSVAPVAVEQKTTGEFNALPWLAAAAGGVALYVLAKKSKKN
jgi:hypothetical protein